MEDIKQIKKDTKEKGIVNERNREKMQYLYQKQLGKHRWHTTSQGYTQGEDKRNIEGRG